MKRIILRKIFIVMIMVAPVISYSGCKKQAKCGCGNDVLFTLGERRAYVYFNESGSNIYASLLEDPYSTYYFCNPGEWFPKMTEFKSGDELVMSGHAYWECNYLYQAGNSTYGSYYKVYNIQVTNLYIDLYGKK